MCDIFVIVLFSTFISMAQGKNTNLIDLINIPISIVLGIILGAITGYILVVLFEKAHNNKQHIRNTMKVIVILGVSFLLISIDIRLQDIIPVSGLLAVVSMASTIKLKSIDFVSKRLSEKFGKLWLAAEVILFVLVGSAVDIRYTLNAGFVAILMIFIALAFRAVGVVVCLIGTKLNWKERFFCIVSYLPKATVQAAIGSVPLSLGLPSGQLVLSVAVLAILITAPIGAFGIDVCYKKLLLKEESL